MPVVVFGEHTVGAEVKEGREVEVEGALTERRWRGAGGSRQSRFEILARTVRVL
jgi:single-stranded DNA-binding protein